QIGKWGGLEQDVNMTDVGIAGGLGALSPVLFGTGATAGKVAAKALAKGVPQEAVEKAQSGLLRHGYNFMRNKAAPKAAQFASGVPPEATRALMENYDFIVNATADDVARLSENAIDQVQVIKGLQDNAGKQISDALAKSGTTI